MAKETGDLGQLSVSPGVGRLVKGKDGKALMDAFVKREIELRKRDQARYHDSAFKIKSIEEAK
jgi:hypothetical protein